MYYFSVFYIEIEPPLYRNFKTPTRRGPKTINMIHFLRANGFAQWRGTPNDAHQKASCDFPPKRTPKTQILKQNGMKSALFCVGGHFKILKTVQTLRIVSQELRYFNVNQLSSRSVQIRALSLIRRVFPFRGEHPIISALFAYSVIVNR